MNTFYCLWFFLLSNFIETFRSFIAFLNLDSMDPFLRGYVKLDLLLLLSTWFRFHFGAKALLNNSNK